ncbi:MAG: cytochrome-c peroxidase [Myxococcales bacterium]|nr:cytochrome-c peroxidase [Myxococcales bacterium]
MRTRLMLGLAVGLALTSACGKKSSEGSGAGTGSAPAPKPPPPPPPSARPSQGTLVAMPPLAASTDPQNAAKVTLGNALFFDKRLSVDGSRACYSCHMNENGTGGALPLALGAGDKPLTRHSPTLWNVGY